MRARISSCPPPRSRALVKLLKRKKNLVLQGPPGTGKTYVAQRLAWLLTGGAVDRPHRGRSVPPVLRIRGLRSRVPAHRHRRFRPTGRAVSAFLRSRPRGTGSPACADHRRDQPRQSEPDLRRVADADRGRQARSRMGGSHSVRSPRRAWVPRPSESPSDRRDEYRRPVHRIGGTTRCGGGSPSRPSSRPLAAGALIATSPMAACRSRCVVGSGRALRH